MKTLWQCLVGYDWPSNVDATICFDDSIHYPDITTTTITTSTQSTTFPVATVAAMMPSMPMVLKYIMKQLIAQLHVVLLLILAPIALSKSTAVEQVNVILNSLTVALMNMLLFALTLTNAQMVLMLVMPMPLMNVMLMPLALMPLDHTLVLVILVSLKLFRFVNPRNNFSLAVIRLFLIKKSGNNEYSFH